MRKGKYLRKKQLFVNIPILTALILFWLVAVTTYLAVGLYAKYTTGDATLDSARAIAFGRLTVEDLPPPLDRGGHYVFVPGVSLEKQITVAFTGSNADCFVFVKAETPGWVANETHRDFTDAPQRLTWSVDDSWIYLPTDEDSHIYYLPLSANTPLPATPFVKNGTVYVHSPVAEDSPIRGLDTRDLYSSDPQQLNINVTAYVVQANGFAGESETARALAAWAALRN